MLLIFNKIILLKKWLIYWFVEKNFKSFIKTLFLNIWFGIYFICLFDVLRFWQGVVVLNFFLDLWKLNYCWMQAIADTKNWNYSVRIQWVYYDVDYFISIWGFKFFKDLKFDAKLDYDFNLFGDFLFNFYLNPKLFRKKLSC